MFTKSFKNENQGLTYFLFSLKISWHKEEKKGEVALYSKEAQKKPQIILKVKNMISHSDLQVDSNLDLILVSF